MRLNAFISVLLLVACKPAADSEASQTPRPSPPVPQPTAPASGQFRVDPRLFEYPAVREADPVMLKASQKYRRDGAWEIVAKAVEPVTADQDGKLVIPRFMTWLDIPEFRALLRRLPGGRIAKPSTAEIDQAIAAVTAEKLRNVPSRESFVARYEDIPDPVKGDGVLRAGQTLFSPAFVRHVLQNRDVMLGCTPEKILEVPIDLEPADAPNFAACLDAEFPIDAAMLKLTWYADDAPRMAYFESDAATLGAAIVAKEWPIAGHMLPREMPATDVFTVNAANGARFKLAAMHIATKELRDWNWVTLWWSRSPDLDFGQDRPASLAAREPAWAHYKMCVVSDFMERDPEPGAAYDETAPGLAASLRAVHDPSIPTTWCANPYIEYEFTNSSCIGCHQLGGMEQKAERRQVRSSFPTDYLFIFETFRKAMARPAKIGE